MIKLPLRINQNPRLRPDSSAASPAVTLEQGYSPPTPTPVRPRAIINIQIKPVGVTPCAAVARIIPYQKKSAQMLLQLTIGYQTNKSSTK